MNIPLFFFLPHNTFKNFLFSLLSAFSIPLSTLDFERIFIFMVKFKVPFQWTYFYIFFQDRFREVWSLFSLLLKPNIYNILYSNIFNKICLFIFSLFHIHHDLIKWNKKIILNIQRMKKINCTDGVGVRSSLH